MEQEQYLSLTQAAKYLNITPQLLLYHIKNNLQPEFTIIAGKKIFKPDTLLRWKKKRS